MVQPQKVVADESFVYLVFWRDFLMNYMMFCWLKNFNKSCDDVFVFVLSHKDVSVHLCVEDSALTFWNVLKYCAATSELTYKSEFLWPWKATFLQLWGFVSWKQGLQFQLVCLLIWSIFLFWLRLFKLNMYNCVYNCKFYLGLVGYLR